MTNNSNHLCPLLALLLTGTFATAQIPAPTDAPKARPPEESARDIVPSTITKPLPTPGMGWSTYNFFIGRHNDQLLHRMADAFVASGLRDAGYNILRLDGGWWGDDGNRRWYYWTEAGEYPGGLPYRPGDPHVDRKNYPGGIKPLADYMHDRKLKLGFYLAPELSTGISANFPGNKEPRLQPPAKELDLVEQHAAWVADNGVDHVFFDGYDWNETKSLEPYTRMSGALRNQARRVGRPIVFSINTGHKLRPAEWADEWRTSRDINGEWATILQCLASVAEPKPAAPGHWNNPDYLMVGFTSDEEAVSQMSLWCVAGAPLYLSWDFRVINNWERYVVLNTEAIAVDQDAAGLSGRRIRSDGAAQVWARPLVDGSRAVALLNAGDKPLTVSVKWSELSLPAGPVQVRNLWTHRNEGNFPDGYRSNDLAPHSCVFLKVTPGEKPPVEPRATWAVHPGRKPDWQPLPTDGWSYRTTMPRKDDPLANLFDHNPKSGFWSYASAGHELVVTFGRQVVFDRLVIDHTGGGPNAWPSTVYAPRSTFRLEGSEDGQTYRKLSEGSFGPAYTIVTLPRTKVQMVRLILTDVERTSAYNDPTWSAKDIYLFDTASASK